MRNKTPRHLDLYFYLFLYIIFLALGLSYHEFWMDESHHWLIAREASSVIDLFTSYKYDGHPILWVFCLWCIGKLTTNIFFVKLFHGAIASTIAAIFLFKSPFRKRHKILFIFSYYPLFEYGILSRNYALGILFLLLFCMSYKKNGKLLLPFFFLGLMSNTHLFGLILSVLLGLKSIYQQRQHLKTHLGAIILLTSMTAFALFTVNTPSDHYFYFDFSKGINIHTLGNLLTIWFKAIVPIPDFWNYNLWNTNFFTSNYKKIAIPIVLLSWISPLFLLKRKSGNFLLFYLYAFTIITFSLFTGLHLSQRIGGFLLYTMIALIWIEKKAIIENNYIINIKENIKLFIISLGLLIQIVCAGLFIIIDVKRPFSNTKNIYEYLTLNIDAETPVYGGLYCNYIGINNYGELNMYLASQEKDIKYCDWRILNINKNKTYLNEAIAIINSKGYEEMVFITPKEIVNFKIPQYGTQLINQFDHALIKNENAFIYLVKKEN